jgi:hypothetical protein
MGRNSNHWQDRLIMLRQTKSPQRCIRGFINFKCSWYSSGKRQQKTCSSIVFASAQSAPHEVVNPITIFGFIKLELDLIAPRLWIVKMGAPCRFNCILITKKDRACKNVFSWRVPKTDNCYSQWYFSELYKSTHASNLVTFSSQNLKGPLKRTCKGRLKASLILVKIVTYQRIESKSCHFTNIWPCINENTTQPRTNITYEIQQEEIRAVSVSTNPRWSTSVHAFIKNWTMHRKKQKKKKSILYIEKTEDFNWGQKQNQSDLENQSLE